MSTESPVSIRMTVYASLFAALISAGAFIAIPIGPVPIVLQNMFVMMAGVLLGWKWGLAAVLVYLFAGAIGFPVYSAGRSGLAHLLGPTGGYLFSYIPAVVTVGLISARFSGKRVFGNLVGMLLGTVIIYTVGVSWLKTVSGLTWEKSVALGMLPFLVGDALKIAAAAYISETIRPMVKG